MIEITIYRRWGHIHVIGDPISNEIISSVAYALAYPYDVENIKVSGTRIEIQEAGAQLGRYMADIHRDTPVANLYDFSVSEELALLIDAIRHTMDEIWEARLNGHND